MFGTPGSRAQLRPLPKFLNSVLRAPRGSILYRGKDGWVQLPPGTAGQVLTSNGAGADPSWTNASGGLWGAQLSATPTQSGTGFNAWENQPTSSTVSDDANGVAVFEPGQGSNHTFALIRKDVSAVATPYQYDILVITPDARITPFHGPVFGFSDGTKGHFIHMQYDNKIGVGYVTTFTGAAFNWETGFPTSDEIPGFAQTYLWMRVKNDGTNLIFSLSRDGVHWYQLGSYAKGSRLTNQNHLIFGGDNFSVGSTHVMASYVKSL